MANSGAPLLLWEIMVLAKAGFSHKLAIDDFTLQLFWLVLSCSPFEWLCLSVALLGQSGWLGGPSLPMIMLRKQSPSYPYGSIHIWFLLMLKVCKVSSGKDFSRWCILVYYWSLFWVICNELITSKVTGDTVVSDWSWSHCRWLAAKRVTESQKISGSFRLPWMEDSSRPSSSCLH